jgi:hypothetical protein
MTTVDGAVYNRIVRKDPLKIFFGPVDIYCVCVANQQVLDLLAVI